MNEPKSMAGAMKQFLTKDRELNPPMTGSMCSSQEAAIKQACDELAETLIKKNRDYGNSNIAEFGEFGVLVRLSDKYNRLKNLVNNKNHRIFFEPIEDSWKDMAGYAVIGWLNSQGRW